MFLRLGATIRCASPKINAKELFDTELFSCLDIEW